MFEETPGLEAKFQTKAELPFVDAFPGQILDTGDGHEVRSIANEAVRSGKVWGISEVERLRPELHSETFGKCEFAKETEVHVKDARTTKDVQAAGSKAGLVDA